jgi:hypothetical protein
LGQDRAGGVVHHGEQVDLLLAVVAAAAEGLAVDGDRLPRGWAGGLKASVHGSRRTPIAASDLAPVSTAATATASTVARLWRRPRRRRGSAISAR